MYFRVIVISEMKNLYLLVVFALLASSCQFFETEKISTETFYKEELKTIDWKDVDQYPAFKECEGQTEKEGQKTCFENTLTTHLYGHINSKKMVATNHLDDTVRLAFTISKTGELNVSKIEVDSVVLHQFPQIKAWMKEGVEALPLVAPAYKRGIPVQTEFVLPIVLKTEDL